MRLAGQASEAAESVLARFARAIDHNDSLSDESDRWLFRPLRASRFPITRGEFSKGKTEMITSLKQDGATRLFSEVSAEELNAVAGGANDMLYDFERKVGVTFQDWGLEWTTSTGAKGYFIFSSYQK